MEHTLEQLETCPSCHSEQLENALECTDFTYSKDSFRIVKCSVCGLHFTNPRPTESTAGTYYENPDYVSHTDTSEGLMFKIYGTVKRYALRQKRRLLGGLTERRTVLDYGAGTGDFSVELSRNGWTVSAYEPDASARAKIRSKNLDIRVVPDISEIDSGSVSAVSLWHVLEHVHRLDETLSHFSRIISEEGHLVIAVPNHISFDAEFYRENWAAYDVPRHLYHFNPATVRPLVEKFGFRLQSRKPMWFDAFYVSLLSEQNIGDGSYLRKLFGWCRAFLIGLVSNAYTLFDTEKCSSIIYIYKKVS